MTDKDFVFRDNYNRNNGSEKDQLENYKNIRYEAAIEELRSKHSRFVKIAATVFIILAVSLAALVFKGRNSADRNQVLLIEKKLGRLESEFTSLKVYIASKLDQAIKEMERDRSPAPAQNPSPAATPAPPPAEQEEPKSKVHKVVAGESLSRISRYHGLTVQQLRDYNNLDAYSVIHPGQELKLTP